MIADQLQQILVIADSATADAMIVWFSYGRYYDSGSAMADIMIADQLQQIL